MDHFPKPIVMTYTFDIRCVHCSAISLKSDGTGYKPKNVLGAYMWAHHNKVILLLLISNEKVGYVYTVYTYLQSIEPMVLCIDLTT